MCDYKYPNTGCPKSLAIKFNNDSWQSTEGLNTIIIQNNLWNYEFWV